jgi:FkbM family methyltransferase
MAPAASLRAGWRRARWLGPLVHERRRFILGELLARSGTHEYRLREPDAIAVVRHNGYDAHVLHEAVRDPFYTPPEPVRALLAAADHEPRVVDLGGNIGCFGLLMLARYPKARVTSFEPDPDNLAVLRRCIARNGHEDRWDVVPACAATEAGETEFVGGQAALSRRPLPGDVSGDSPTLTVPMVDVFDHLRDVDVLKIDIEGGEWALLDDPRFVGARPTSVLLEWHTYDCPEDNPRRAAANRLEAMGYEIRHEKPPEVPDSEPLYGAGTLWAWRRDST